MRLRHAPTATIYQQEKAAKNGTRRGPRTGASDEPDSHRVPRGCFSNVPQWPDFWPFTDSRSNHLFQSMHTLHQTQSVLQMSMGLSRNVRREFRPY